MLFGPNEDLKPTFRTKFRNKFAGNVRLAQCLTTLEFKRGLTMVAMHHQIY